MKDNFFSHSKNYLLAELFNKGIVFLSIPIFTYLLLPEEYGIISIFITLTSIFTIIMGLNFHTTVTRKYHEGDDFNQFLGTNIIFLIIINILLLMILYMFQDDLASFFSVDGDILFIAAILGSFSVFLGIELAYLKTSQDSKKYTKILVIRNVLLTIGALIWMYSLDENRYLGKIYAELLVMGLMFLIVMYNILKLSKFNFSIKHIKYSISYGIPLIPHALAGLVLLQSDILIINNISGNYETGLYSFAYNIGMLMNVVVVSLNNAWLPIFYKNLNIKGYSQIQSLSEKYVKIIFLITMVLILFSKEIITIMADEKYAKALEVIPIIILSFTMVFLYILYANYSFYRKKTWLIAFFTVMAAGINVALNFLFIPKYGYVAAAWTTLVSYYVLFMLHYINVKFILKETVINISNILMNLVILLIGIFVYYNMNTENYFMLLIYKIILLIGISGFFFWKRFLAIFKV